MKPDSRNPTWRARCDDPDTGKRVKVRLDPMGSGRNAQTRRLWAIDKAKVIAQRRDELASGAPRATGTSLPVAVARYYEDHPRLRPRTVAIYQLATAKLISFAERRGIRASDQLTLADLTAFRATLARSPKHESSAKAPRGGKRTSQDLRSAGAVNVELRAVRTVLGHLRRLGLTVRLTTDDLTDGLKQFEREHDAPEFLRSPDIKKLVEAAHKHDAATYKATRDEHAKRLEGSTPRYEPITPLILTALFTGMRFGELIELDWSEVDLTEGEIRLGTRTKTKRARTVALEVSPALTALMEGLWKEAGEPSSGSVWNRSVDQVKAAAKRLANYGAPKGWTWQALRRTCGTFLTCAPGIFGAASAYRSARQLGHSVAIAERHYVGVVKVPKEATTLEEAMGIESELAKI